MILKQKKENAGQCVNLVYVEIKGGKVKINLEDNKGQIITSVEIQEDDTLENIDGFYEVKKEGK